MRKAIVIPVLAVVILGAGAAAAVAAYDHSHRDVIAPGVQIAGVPVGGLHAPAAAVRVRSALTAPLARPVVVRAAGHRFRLSPARVHARVDVDSLVSRAVAISRDGSVITRTLHGL